MDWKSTGKKILFPPVWLIVLFAIISAVALVAVFVKGWEEAPVAYAVYVFSFYSLTVLCAALGMALPKCCREIKRRISGTKYGNLYMNDMAFKTHISLHLSFGVNLLYAGVNALMFFLYRSMWFAILAGYYIILAVMRFLLLRYMGGNKIGKDPMAELRRSRLCAIILLTVNLVLSGAVLMILYQDKGFQYHGIWIYVMAAYTFYMAIHAIVDVIKYRKYNSPVMMIAKIIALSAALVSMLSLETAMLSQFGADMPAKNKWIIIAATGAGVSIAVVAMSVYMLVWRRNYPSGGK